MCVAPLENKLNYAYYEQPLGSLFVTLLIGILASQSWTAHRAMFKLGQNCIFAMSFG